MSDPVPPPLPPMPYPGTLTEEQRRALGDFLRWLAGLLYPPPPVPPGPPPQPPPTLPGPMAGDTLASAAAGWDCWTGEPGAAPADRGACGPVREAAAVALLVLDAARDGVLADRDLSVMASRAGDCIRGALWSQP